MPHVEWIDVDGGGESKLDDEGELHASNIGMPGTCDICGAKAYHHFAKKCQEHRHSTNERAQANKDTKRKRTPPSGGGNGPNSARWQRTISKVLLIVTSFVAVGIVSKANILDSDDSLIDELSLTDDEALDIAAPLARMMSKTSLSEKYGKVVVDNDDFIDAAMAVSDYVKRVRETTAKIERIVHNRQNMSKQPNSAMPGPAFLQQDEGIDDDDEPTGSHEEDRGENGYFGPRRGDYARPIYTE